MSVENLSAFARGVIESLELEPHPEGGWYRRTWQSSLVIGTGDTTCDGDDMGEYATGARPLASLIYFLLPTCDASAWHKVDADELWLWHGPGPVTLELGGAGSVPDTEGATQVTLGVSLDDPAHACAQVIIPAGLWQRTLPSTDDALVSCVVSPGFTFAGFTMRDE